MGALDQDDDRRRERGSFEGEFGASHCSQCGFCCVVVQKCMNQLNCCFIGE